MNDHPLRNEPCDNSILRQLCTHRESRQEKHDKSDVCLIVKKNRNIFNCIFQDGELINRLEGAMVTILSLEAKLKELAALPPNIPFENPTADINELLHPQGSPERRSTSPSSHQV